MDARQAIKIGTFYAAQAGGLLALARRCTRRGLRILCYHGIALQDEHLFNPVVFMQLDTFRARMKEIARLRYPVISLDTALSGVYPDNAVVLTFDDGWSGTIAAAEICHEMEFPSTLYVASYYVQTRTQVFNVLVRYVALKARKMVSLSRGLKGNLSDEAFQKAIIDMGEGIDWQSRQALADELCLAAGLPDAGSLFRFLTPSQLCELPALGMNVQLHTHRHQFFLEDDDRNCHEIGDNRDALTSFGIPRGNLKHFCYPSGEFNKARLGVLSDCGIVSATTTIAGMNYEDASPMMLRRFTDSDSLPAIDFRATLAGLPDLIRRPQIVLSEPKSFRAVG